ncbi:MAG: EAL domain-containing protein [Acidobacteriota bacterium]
MEGGASSCGRVVFEITERAAIEDFDRFRASIAPLRNLGYRIAVDDLGSGYAGLNSIANIEPDFIKFDMTLIREIDQNPLRQNLIRTFVKFAESIPSQVIAEGVETESEKACLEDLGCHFLQGYYFARPGPPFPKLGVHVNGPTP